jgi:deoxycytidylate deaminase
MTKRLVRVADIARERVVAVGSEAGAIRIVGGGKVACGVASGLRFTQYGVRSSLVESMAQTPLLVREASPTARKGRSERSCDAIDDRLSQELVVAMIGPVGSGVSRTSTIINETLRERFDYQSRDVIKLSSVIDEDAHKVGCSKSTGMGARDRIDHLQETGNRLRQQYGSDYLAKRAIGVIALDRAANGFEELEKGGPPRPRRMRSVWIIDSLKNDEELALLRSVYKDVLLVFGVFAPEHIRKRRLRQSGITEAEIGGIMDRDQGEVLSHGQRTRTIFSDADFFIRNDEDNDTELRKLIVRFLDLVFDIGVHTPTRFESAMQEAYSVSNRSGCMSRQVGAAIVDKNGGSISVGWNDVPKFGGGLYLEQGCSTLSDGLN